MHRLFRRSSTYVDRTDVFEKATNVLVRNLLPGFIVVRASDSGITSKMERIGSVENSLAFFVYHPVITVSLYHIR